MTYFIKANQHTNELAEGLGYNIAGAKFVHVRFLGDDTVRGYVEFEMMPFGVATMKKGPITLHVDDIEKG